MQGLGITGHWIGVHDADPRAVALYRRHYSANLKKEHLHGFGGQGRKLVLLTLACDALFVWIEHPEEMPMPLHPDKRTLKRLARTNGPKKYAKQGGVMCSVFRNEGPVQSRARAAAFHVCLGSESTESQPWILLQDGRLADMWAQQRWAIDDFGVFA